MLLKTWELVGVESSPHVSLREKYVTLHTRQWKFDQTHINNDLILLLLPSLYPTLPPSLPHPTFYFIKKTDFSSKTPWFRRKNTVISKNSENRKVSWDNLWPIDIFFNFFGQAILKIYAYYKTRLFSVPCRGDLVFIEAKFSVFSSIFLRHSVDNCAFLKIRS